MASITDSDLRNALRIESAIEHAFGMSSLIDEDAWFALPGRWIRLRWRRFPRAEKMDDRLTRKHQIIRNNPPMAAPPYGLGTHDYACPFVAQAP